MLLPSTFGQLMKVIVVNIAVSVSHGRRPHRYIMHIKSTLFTGHGEELAFLFHNAPLAGFHYTEDEEELSQQLITYWTNFARHGNPNGANSHFDWPQFTPDTKSVLRFLTPNNKVRCM